MMCIDIFTPVLKLGDKLKIKVIARVKCQFSHKVQCLLVCYRFMIYVLHKIYALHVFVCVRVEGEFRSVQNVVRSVDIERFLLKYKQ